MVWQQWVVTGILATSGLATASQVGKPRPATTGGVAAAVVVIQALMILMVASI